MRLLKYTSTRSYELTLVACKGCLLILPRVTVDFLLTLKPSLLPPLLKRCLLPNYSQVPFHFVFFDDPYFYINIFISIPHTIIYNL